MTADVHFKLRIGRHIIIGWSWVRSLALAFNADAIYVLKLLFKKDTAKRSPLLNTLKANLKVEFR